MIEREFEMTLGEPTGETTHWTGRAMAKAAGAGKPAKVAITAIMRKLAILANPLLKDHGSWTPNAA